MEICGLAYVFRVGLLHCTMAIPAIGKTDDRHRKVILDLSAGRP